MGYTLYGSSRSRGFRVLWMLEELGVEYDHVVCGPHSEEIRAVNRSGKVPALRDGETVIPDSSAILTYLADKHGRFTAPAGTPERARQDAWTFRILDDLEGPLWMAAKHTFVLPEDERKPEAKESFRAEFQRSLTRIMEEMDGPYLMGAEVTVPDFILCHIGGWSRAAKFPDGPPAFKDYLKRLRGREGFARAAALG